MISDDIILSTDKLAAGYALSGGREYTVLENISLKAKKGELVVLIGRNGTGKSTLLRTLAVLQSSIAGNIYYAGKESSQYAISELARTISFVSAGNVRVQHLSVRDMVALGRHPYTNMLGRLRLNDWNIVDDAIQKVQADHIAGNDIARISDGERQRVMIARAIAQDTPLILLDEPTAFLDLANRFEILRVLSRLAAEIGKAVIMSSHDLHLALQVADKIWLIDEGKIMEGAPEDLIISGIFNKLFRDSGVIFDQDSGEFRFAGHYVKTIRLEGDKDIKSITEKALNRLGFRVTVNSEGSGVVEVKKEKGKPVWELDVESGRFTFYSIYDLSVKLKKLVK